MNGLCLWKKNLFYKFVYQVQAALVILGLSIHGFGYSRFKIWYQNLVLAVLSLAYSRCSEKFWHKYSINWLKCVITEVPCYSRFWYSRDIWGTQPLRITRAACILKFSNMVYLSQGTDLVIRTRRSKFK